LARSACHWRWLRGGLTDCGIWGAVEQESFNILDFLPGGTPADFEYTTFESQLDLGEASIVFV